ncbi:MFS transporter [Actinomyces sp. MRS3W]|uniref:MFS transporter n=1 Tax=Actinomyces sp. MRS3W TaxID=2800796 RepID=UPI0028FD9E5C|nr:MFS transporter [Actinomyces sp. MRS3W]MDU0348287.1 MFS transporter [Actinomyces sp. MRS3W]
MPDKGLGVYASLLRTPHIARSVAFGVLGEFPYPFLGMGLLIGIRDGYGSYTLAGTVSAVMAVVSAVAGPTIGRLIDIYGQKRAGVPIAIFWITSISAMSAALHFHAPAWVVVGCAVMLGINCPCNSMMRARWRYALADQPWRLGSMLSLTSILEEMMWMVGNPLATVLATSVALLAPMAAAVLFVLIGVCSFVMDVAIQPKPRGSRRGLAGRPAERADDAAPGAAATAASDAPVPAAAAPAGAAAPVAAKEPLLSRALVSLFAVNICYGAFQSTTSIAIVSLADELGQPGRAGTVIACFSAASMISALAYGARIWASPLWIRFYVGLGALALGCSALLLVHTLPAAAIVMFVAGLA